MGLAKGVCVHRGPSLDQQRSGRVGAGLSRFWSV
jgi:hypothetical protein